MVKLTERQHLAMILDRDGQFKNQPYPALSYVVNLIIDHFNVHKDADFRVVHFNQVNLDGFVKVKLFTVGASHRAQPRRMDDHVIRIVNVQIKHFRIPYQVIQSMDVESQFFDIRCGYNSDENVFVVVIR